ncbi:hypothetical protein IJ531_04520 [bacterium]|nr:hypothetical protein [bacterium]
MIQRLGASSLSFKANELPSGRSAYSLQIDKNTKTAQMQNDKISSMPVSVNNTQIAMQGQTQNTQAQKLDVIA